MVTQKHYKFKGAADKLISADLSYAKYQGPVPICVFVHGFKGFKDWGAWPLAAQVFAVKGLPFFKFNFSMNGTSPQHPTEFVDLEAFSHNTLSTELSEVGLVLDFIAKKQDSFDFEWDQRIFLIGHSRGGGIALLTTANDERVSKCATWASVSHFGRYMQLADSDQWLKDGVTYVENSRTGQKMPIKVNFYLDMIEQGSKLNILEQIENMEQDLLVVHGENDTVVSMDDANKIYSAVGHAIKVDIENADHTFNITHPLTEKKISLAFAQAMDETIEFFLM